jgi:hypothetical protein
MLVGQQPFFGPDVNTILHQVMNGEPPPLPPKLAAAGVLPKEIEAVLRRALSKRQQDRFPTITAFARAFEAAAPAPAPTPPPVPRAAPAPKPSSLFVGQNAPPPAPRKRSPLTWVVAILLAAAVGIGVAWFTRADRLPFALPGTSSIGDSGESAPTIVPLQQGKPPGAKEARRKRPASAQDR